MRKAILIALAGLAAQVFGANGGGYPDKHVFVWRTYDTDKQVAETSNIVYNAKACGYTGMMLICGRNYSGHWSMLKSPARDSDDYRTSKAGVDDIGSWRPDRLARLKAVRKLCADLNFAFIPVVWAVGYCSMQIMHPDFVAVAPNRGVPYVRRGGTAVHEAERTEVANAGFETLAENGATPASWTCDGVGKFVSRDENVKHSGASSLRLDMTAASRTCKDPVMARAYQKVKLLPNRRYCLRAWLKTDRCDFGGGGEPRLIVSDGKIRIANRSFLIRGTQDWMQAELVFNSLHGGDMFVYVGGWKVKSGTLWFDDVTLDLLGAQQVVQRAGTPVCVRDAATGKAYREGKDYRPFPRLKIIKFDCCDTDLALEIPSGSSIPEGARLLVDTYEPVTAAGVQYSACLSNPDLKPFFRESARNIWNQLRPDGWVLSEDEFRAGCRCELCQKNPKTIGRRFGESVADMCAAIRAVDSDADIFVWGDMFDRNHNAHKDYYICGDFSEGVDYLPKDLTVVSWWDEKAADSFKFFSSRGYRTMAAGYYDQMTPDRTIKNARKWLDAMNETPNCRGILYTTWNGEVGHYDFLPLFSKVVDRYGKPVER